MARDSYSYIHLLMVAGIVLSALGLKKTIGDVDEPLKTIPAVALLGGTALYLTRPRRLPLAQPPHAQPAAAGHGDPAGRPDPAGARDLRARERGDRRRRSVRPDRLRGGALRRSARPHPPPARRGGRDASLSREAGASCAGEPLKLLVARRRSGGRRGRAADGRSPPRPGAARAQRRSPPCRAPGSSIRPSDTNRNGPPSFLPSIRITASASTTARTPGSTSAVSSGEMASISNAITPPAQHVAGLESLAPACVLVELVQAGGVAVHDGVELLHQCAAIPVVMAVREQDVRGPDRPLAEPVHRPRAAGPGRSRCHPRRASRRRPRFRAWGACADQ